MNSRNCTNYFGTYLMTSRSGPVQIVLADGSVRPVNTSISQATLISLVDPQDGTPLGNDF